jgi:hypothetical protein
MALPQKPQAFIPAHHLKMRLNNLAGLIFLLAFYPHNPVKSKNCGSLFFCTLIISIKKKGGFRQWQKGKGR